jgi:hypothetical protein
MNIKMLVFKYKIKVKYKMHKTTIYRHFLGVVLEYCIRGEAVYLLIFINFV